MIQQTLLNHGHVPYQYMIHRPKMELLVNNGFSPLKNFLRETFANCPDEPFRTGPRSSALKFSLGIEPKKVENHEVIHLAREGLLQNRWKTAHSNVQGFMLSKDSSTIAVEVPLWLHQKEFSQSLKFSQDGPLSGHVDILRVEDGKIWIWDYKPKAVKEKYATTQTYFYSLMMSKRSGIPLDKFMCGYFDDKDCFIFKPDEKYMVEKNALD
jgi:hypothetical protein